MTAPDRITVDGVVWVRVEGDLALDAEHLVIYPADRAASSVRYQRAPTPQHGEIWEVEDPDYDVRVVYVTPRGWRVWHPFSAPDQLVLSGRPVRLLGRWDDDE